MEVFLPSNLFQEESNAEIELLVQELGQLIIIEVRIDAIGVKGLVPLCRGGDTKCKREQTKCIGPS
jgi:hypothetical protein